MFFHQRFVPGLAIYSYIVGDPGARQAAVVDPTRDVDEILRVARANNLRITHVLETHVHADFVSGARELKARLGGEPQILASAMGGDEWTPRYADVAVRDGHEIQLGATRIRAVHTPGHTPEHMAWAVFDDTRSRETPCLLLSGDFLFVGSVGRPDLLGAAAQTELARQLYRSVFERAASIPDFTDVFPGHGAGSLCGKALGARSSTTLGYERRYNEALAKRPLDEWVTGILADMPAAPPYFARLKRVNRDGPAILPEPWPGRRAIAPAAAAAMMAVGRDVVVLDVRAKEAFAAGHIPGAISIPHAPTLSTWAGWVLPEDARIVLVLARESDLDETLTQLLRVGFDRIEGYVDGGIEAWELAGRPLAVLASTSVHELEAERTRAKAGLAILDVRTPGEWRAGAIPGAVHIPVTELPARLAEVPRDKPLAVICGSGYRSSIACSLILRVGHAHVTNVMGGMTAWRAASLPAAAPPAAR